ncbi:MAG: Rieske 2Fe-2S domain-containing protein [Gammaproteobacteria bacterium]|nr:Rieske 2Fe-2S domain-containing protein [Gammaproteobacteria bacterium]
MTKVLQRACAGERNWQRLMALSELASQSVKMLRIAGKQIAVFKTPDGIRACDNRCPHEGFPLSEGSLSSDCILTCNWHNWKFNLESGENLYGGDRLRTYALEIRGDDIWIDITELPYEERYLSISASLRDAFDDYSYDRIAREIARLIRLGADPMDALRLAIDWSWQRMEFGWTHAYAGMADWLQLYDEHPGDAEIQLACLVESVAHAAYDVLREPEYPFTADVKEFDADRFVADIEAENEAAAVAAIRGGIRAGLEFVDFEEALSRAALQHYNDFGHALIYLTKAGALIKRLGEAVMEPLLLSLVREMVYASREDKIPEFRAYGAELEKWGRHGDQSPDPAMWRRKSINKSLKAAVACSGSEAEEIYRALLLANAINLLSFDIAQQDKIHVSVSGNVGWLDFTHGLTFASAVRQQCSRFPRLWPQGLLQMACFNGRNAGFTDDSIDLDSWRPENMENKLAVLIERVLDHGQGEHIVSVHLLKSVLAVRQEIRDLDSCDAEILVAALTRFFDSPLKRRQVRRTAFQSLQFVAKE